MLQSCFATGSKSQKALFRHKTQKRDRVKHFNLVLDHWFVRGRCV